MNLIWFFRMNHHDGRAKIIPSIIQQIAGKLFFNYLGLCWKINTCIFYTEFCKKTGAADAEVENCRQSVCVSVSYFLPSTFSSLSSTLLQSHHQ